MKKLLMTAAFVSIAGFASAECVPIATEVGPDGGVVICVVPSPTAPSIEGAGVAGVTADGVGAGVGVGTNGAVTGVGTYGDVSGSLSVGPEGSSFGVGVSGTF